MRAFCTVCAPESGAVGQLFGCVEYRDRRQVWLRGAHVTLEAAYETCQLFAALKASSCCWRGSSSWTLCLCCCWSFLLGALPSVICSSLSWISVVCRLTPPDETDRKQDIRGFLPCCAGLWPQETLSLGQKGPEFASTPHHDSKDSVRQNPEQLHCDPCANSAGQFLQHFLLIFCSICIFRAEVSYSLHWGVVHTRGLPNISIREKSLTIRSARAAALLHSPTLLLRNQTLCCNLLS